MVRYFKINDPYRLLILFLFLALTRVVFLVTGGEQLGLDNRYFNPNVSDGRGPLFIWLANFVVTAFKSPLIPSAVISALLITLQSFSINSILINNKALSQNTYLPAACYVILMSASPEFMLNSPALMSVTLLLMGINYMLYHLHYRGSEENIISTGFMFGTAILLHPASAVFVLFIYCMYLLYSSTLNRRYVLIGFGVLLPLIMVWVYFLWQDQGSQFWMELFEEIVGDKPETSIAINQLVLFMAFPILISLISASRSFTGVGLTNHQIIVQRAFLIFGIFALGSIFLNDRISTNSLIYLVPGTVFYIAQFLLDLQRKWLAELLFVLLLLWSLGFLLIPLVGPELALVDFNGLK